MQGAQEVWNHSVWDGDTPVNLKSLFLKINIYIDSYHFM